MNDLRTAAQQALEALCCVRDMVAHPDNLEFIDRNVAALRAALAQQAEPVQDLIPPESLFVCDQMGAHVTRVRLAQQAEPVEPVAEARYDGTLRWLEPHGVGLHRIQGPLFTAPPQRKPLPKHDQHCVDVPGYGLMAVRLVRAVERAHRIGGQDDNVNS